MSSSGSLTEDGFETPPSDALLDSRLRMMPPPEKKSSAALLGAALAAGSCVAPCAPRFHRRYESPDWAEGRGTKDCQEKMRRSDAKRERQAASRQKSREAQERGRAQR